MTRPNDQYAIGKPLPACDSNLSRRELLSAIGVGALACLHSGCMPGTDSSLGDFALDGPLHFASLTDVAGLIESGGLSSVELTELMLARIETIDSRLMSYATLMADHAREAARSADEEILAGRYRGPLHGIPVAVKDLCYTRGVSTMGGSGALSNFVPEYDATVVTKLKESGAVLLGKLNLTEGAMGGYHPDFELPVNPWHEELWAGASSSGSGVATAAGLCFASLGTDTGGSIRFPSMANGIVGLKPTYGRVSRYGVLPLAESLDHVGPMARSVSDAAIVLQAIAGRDSNDSTSLNEPVPDVLAEIGRGVSGTRIGFDVRYATEGVDPNLSASIEAALGVLEGLGAEIVTVEMPNFPPALVDVWFTICSYEARRAHAATYPSRAAQYGTYFREFLEIGSGVTDEAYANATAARNEFNRQFLAVLETIDVVACPSGGAPFAIPAEVVYGGMAGFDPYMSNLLFQFTIPADFAGTPTISLPCGATPDGVPQTIQFMGRALSESMLCRIAYGYEQATEWHTRHPTV
jgi:amidase